MKVFAGFMLGTLTVISLMYGYFGFFVLTLVAGLILWLSTQPRLMDNEDYSNKKALVPASTNAM